jgi:hypothetical protein
MRLHPISYLEEHQLLGKLASIVVAVSLLGVGLALAPSAQAAGTSGSPQSPLQGGSQTACHTLYIHLNGSLPATATCLDREAQLAGVTPGPLTSLDGTCNSAALWIYSDTNYSGSRICFRGSGSVNMGDYTYNCSFGLCYSWNDVASSYWAGCSGGTFYQDTNDSGTAQNFGYIEKNLFDGQGGRLSNDSLSSVKLNSNC